MAAILALASFAPLLSPLRSAAAANIETEDVNCTATSLSTTFTTPAESLAEGNLFDTSGSSGGSGAAICEQAALSIQLCSVLTCDESETGGSLSGTIGWNGANVLRGPGGCSGTMLNTYDLNFYIGHTEQWQFDAQTVYAGAVNIPGLPANPGVGIVSGLSQPNELDDTPGHESNISGEATGVLTLVRLIGKNDHDLPLFGDETFPLENPCVNEDVIGVSAAADIILNSTQSIN
jgi:hypothetical protein